MRRGWDTQTVHAVEIKSKTGCASCVSGRGKIKERRGGLGAAVVTTFAHIVPVLSSNSESILKTGLVFAYELHFRRSIYANRSEKNSDPSIPHIVGVEDFYFGQKVVTRSSFHGHKVFVDFEHVFWKFHRPRLSLV